MLLVPQGRALHDSRDTGLLYVYLFVICFVLFFIPSIQYVIMISQRYVLYYRFLYLYFFFFKKQPDVFSPAFVMKGAIKETVTGTNVR